MLFIMFCIIITCSKKYSRDKCKHIFDSNKKLAKTASFCILVHNLQLLFYKKKAIGKRIKIKQTNKKNKK